MGQLLSDSMLLPKERMMQFGLDLRSFSIDAPRQLSQLLRRFSSDELVFSLQLEGLEALRTSLERLSQRVSLAILVASLLLSATLMASLAQQELLFDSWLSTSRKKDYCLLSRSVVAVLGVAAACGERFLEDPRKRKSRDTLYTLLTLLAFSSLLTFLTLCAFDTLLSLVTFYTLLTLFAFITLCTFFTSGTLVALVGFT